MASLFAITAPTNGIRLGEKRSGQASFSVFNSSGRNVRVRLRLAALSPEAEQWIRISDDAERVIPIAGTLQCTVEIEVPESAAEGSYSFRLDAIGQDNPDEDYTEGPAVTFVVPAPVVKERRGIPWWIIAAAVAAVVVIGVAVFVIFRPRNVTVPDVAQLAFSQAVQRLEESGLAAATETIDESSISVPIGSVIRTDPPAESSVRRGSGVTLVLSSGPNLVTIPAVGGRPFEQAAGSIEQAGLEVGARQEETSESVAVNSVIRTQPPIGTQVRVGSEVSLVVSSGPAPRPVPDVESMSVSAATASLRAAGLQVSATNQVFHGTVASGLAIRTQPAAGTEVERGTEVTLFTSTGPFGTVIDDFVGTWAAADGGSALRSMVITKASESALDVVATISAAVASAGPAPMSPELPVVRTAFTSGGFQGQGSPGSLDIRLQSQAVVPGAARMRTSLRITITLPFGATFPVLNETSEMQKTLRIAVPGLEVERGEFDEIAIPALP